MTDFLILSFQIRRGHFLKRRSLLGTRKIRYFLGTVLSLHTILFFLHSHDDSLDLSHGTFFITFFALDCLFRLLDMAIAIIFLDF
jgi:hypothetical protein